MDKIEMRIVRLEPTRVAAALGFGREPEVQSWDKLLTFAQKQGLWQQPGHRFFGFNNPSPSVGSPNYGYEQWMTVDNSVQAEGDVQVKDFPGGLYAVTRCQGVPNPQIWQKLVAAVEEAGYEMTGALCLEECLTPEILSQAQPDFNQLAFDLYEPIAK